MYVPVNQEAHSSCRNKRLASSRDVKNVLVGRMPASVAPLKQMMPCASCSNSSSRTKQQLRLHKSVQFIGSMVCHACLCRESPAAMTIDQRGATPSACDAGHRMQPPKPGQFSLRTPLQVLCENVFTAYIVASCVFVSVYVYV